MLILPLTVALCQHGRICFCNRSFGLSRVLSRIRRHNTHDLLYQYLGHITSLFLLYLWSKIWIETDGFVKVLLWMVWS